MESLLSIQSPKVWTHPTSITILSTFHSVPSFSRAFNPANSNFAACQNFSHEAVLKLFLRNTAPVLPLPVIHIFICISNFLYLSLSAHVWIRSLCSVVELFLVMSFDSLRLYTKAWSPTPVPINLSRISRQTKPILNAWTCACTFAHHYQLWYSVAYSGSLTHNTYSLLFVCKLLYKTELILHPDLTSESRIRQNIQANWWNIRFNKIETNRLYFI